LNRVARRHRRALLGRSAALWFRLGAAPAEASGVLQKGPGNQDGRGARAACSNAASRLLFLVVEKMTTDRALGALSKLGGTVLKSSLSEDAERALQQMLHGTKATDA
jgi:uncharacterized membrane protein